ncbi:MAG: carboxylating nicotinate-nucleotide diphosphorylase [Myxococcales bacterium]|nr:carboxylating nicotinate-nucleotide diphosphorylase [Myxococcales bacterium]
MVPAFPLASLVDPILDRALAEDLAGGDLTSEACIPPDHAGRGEFVARGPIVACGLTLAARVFARVDPSVRVTHHVVDGDRVAAGGALLRVEGRARSLLMGERVALNFVQRLSGIATATRAFVDAIPAGGRLRIVDTRKTTPGLRVLERYAVRCGGGHNHRDMLGSAVLIKDNHIVVCGSVRAAIERARAHAPHTTRIECEVDTLEQLDEALAAGADVVLLDNMDDSTTREAVRRVRAQKGDQVTVEASGNVAIERIPALSATGVDVVSIGALTHSVRAADVGLDLHV